MTANELRELAEKVDRDELTGKDATALFRFLRACADALDAGFVRGAVLDHDGVALIRNGTELRRCVERGSKLLYPVALPAPASDLSEGQYRDMLDAESAPYPVAIRALLDRLKAAEAENERLREFERSAACTLPGVYYMDPPDGGDVSLLKQLQRMSIDAARYRLLRRKFAIMSDGKGNAEFYPINLPRPTYIAPNTAIELDTALDRERLGMDAAADTYEAEYNAARGIT